MKLSSRPLRQYPYAGTIIFVSGNLRGPLGKSQKLKFCVAIEAKPTYPGKSYPVACPPPSEVMSTVAWRRWNIPDLGSD